MDSYKVDDSEVLFEEITADGCNNAAIKSILVNTKISEAIVIHNIKGTQAFALLKKFIQEHEDKFIFYVFNEDPDVHVDYLSWLNKMSMQTNIIICCGFKDVSYLTDSVSERILVYKDSKYWDFVSRLEAWRAGAFMAGTSSNNMEYLEIFADCFEGVNVSTVLDVMKQLNKALGKGGLSDGIKHSLDKADHIGEHKAVKSSIFGN